MFFSYSYTIRLADTDAAGVIYFARLLSICHEAYESSLETVGIDFSHFFRDTTTAIPIVHSSIDFFRPIFCGDKLTIALIPKRLSDREFQISYEVLAANSRQCLAMAKTRHVCINPTTRKKIALPAFILQWLAQYQV